MGNSETLKEKILSACQSPGVYLMRDGAGAVLYVGKAKNLKKRLLSYTRPDLSRKTAALMQKVQDVQLKVCASEELALLLEASLVRQLKPKYNVSLRDDKSFPLVKISEGDYPAIYITRKRDNLSAQRRAPIYPLGSGTAQHPALSEAPVRASAQYIGPYTNVKLLKNALKIIRSNFAYRSCKRMPKQSCIYYRINLCPGCCIGKISRKEYARNIDNIILILNGKTDILIRDLTRTMQDRSSAMDFEAAARLRDQITVLSEHASHASGLSGVNFKKETEDLKNRLGLSKSPIRIEGFDISNIFGKQAVGSMVSFRNGIPDKNNYRRFRIKTVRGIDDYKMLAEIVRRRYARVIKENGVLPDLLLIDGGKGQLLAAVKQLKYLRINLPVISIAKPCKIMLVNGLAGKKGERIYSSCKPYFLKFVEDTPALNLIRRVRDEAHRFALAYHQLLRKKALIGS